MKRILACTTVTAVAMCLLSAPALAVDDMTTTHPSGSLGFHDIDAPIGARWWLSDKIGLDLGLGLQWTPAPSYDEHLNDWTVDAGVPIVLKNWERVHFLFRPGILFDSQEVQMTSPPDAFATDDQTTFAITAELEAEIFIVENVSVSASHGVQFITMDPAGGGDSETSFGTRGNEFTGIGFHVYFFGGDLF